MPAKLDTIGNENQKHYLYTTLYAFKFCNRMMIINKSIIDHI